MTTDSVKLDIPNPFGDVISDNALSDLIQQYGKLSKYHKQKFMRDFDGYMSDINIIQTKEYRKQQIELLDKNYSKLDHNVNGISITSGEPNIYILKNCLITRYYI